MDKLKRSEKLCPQCKSKNAIRCFNCKSCNFTFPQKIKPEKEKTNNSTIDNKKMIEEFLKKTSTTKIFERKNVNESILNNTDDNANINQTIKENENNKNMINFIDCILTNNNIDLNNNKGIELENKIKIGQIYESNQLSKITLEFDNFDLGKNYSCDFFQNKNTILGVIAYFDQILEKIILSCVEFNFFSTSKEECDLYNIINDSDIIPHSFKLKDYRITSIIACPESEINNDVSRFSVNIIKNTRLFLFSFSNCLFLYVYHENKIHKLSEIKLNDYINKFDAIKIDFEKSDDKNNKAEPNSEISIKLIVSDYENKIYLYTFSNVNKIFNLISIYEKHFNYKITDLKFLPLTETLKINNQVKTKYLFGASSRDGTLKIFDTFNPCKVVFNHRSTELWITKFFYDKKNDILFYFVNSNLTERVVSIKFFNHKEYSIKRIPETEYSIYCHIDELFDRLYILKGDCQIKYIEVPSIVDMHIFHRSKKLKIILNKFYSPHDCILNNDFESSIIDKLNRLDKTTFVKEKQDHLDFNSQFFLFNFLEGNSSTLNQILIIPSLNKISINFMTKTFK